MSFETELTILLDREGGFKLHEIPGDSGGLTYAGIARRKNPQWPGWTYLDKGLTPPVALVIEFYRTTFWNPVHADALPAGIGATIFDFAVNAGVRVASELAQVACGAEVDGSIGAKTIAALCEMSPNEFRAAYALAKIQRYADIVNKDRTQSKFLLGWINRALSQA